MAAMSKIESMLETLTTAAVATMDKLRDQVVLMKQRINLEEQSRQASFIKTTQGRAKKARNVQHNSFINDSTRFSVVDRECQIKRVRLVHPIKT